MKRLAFIAAILGIAAGGPVRSPKDVATSGTNAPMVRVTKVTLPVPGQAAQTVTITNAVVRSNKPPWRVSKSFMFTLPLGATGVRVYFGTNQGVYNGSAFFPSPVSVITATNMNPWRPYWFAFVSVGNGGLETPIANSSTTALLQVSPSTWNDSVGQHFAVNGSASNTITVSAESVLNGMKSTVGTFTNQPVISFVRPARAQEFYILK